MPTKASINQSKYDKENTVRYSIKLNKATNRDLIELIDNTASRLKTSKQGAIKYLMAVSMTVLNKENR